MSSGPVSKPLIIVMVLVASSGWVVAWNASRQPNPGENGGAKGAALNGRSGSNREDQGASPANFVKDGATARLLSSFAEIDAGAVSGRPNETLLHACRGALTDANIQRRERNYSLLLELMRPEDGPALHELFLELHREGRAYGDYKTFATRWGEIDAEGALKYLNDQVPKVLPAPDFRAIARGWGQKDPVAALKWMSENPEMAADLNGRPAVLEGWMRENPTEASGWLQANMQTLQPEEAFECIRIGMTEQVNGATTDVMQAATWLAALPDDPLSALSASRAWDTAQWSLGELPYDKAAELWSKVADEPWLNFGQFRHFSGAISHSRVASDGMNGYLQALEKTWPQERITAQFQRWAQKEPAVIAAWLEEAPDSAVTQAGIKGLVQVLEASDPTTAAAWAERLKQ